jgi:hypothetical protein
LCNLVQFARFDLCDLPKADRTRLLRTYARPVRGTLGDGAAGRADFGQIPAG